MKPIHHIRELITPLAIASWNESLKTMSLSRDGFIFTQHLDSHILNNSIFNEFSDLPPHADYDFHVKHFSLALPQNTDCEDELKKMILQEHPLLHFFENSTESLRLEHAYLSHSKSQWSKTPPLILNFTSNMPEAHGNHYLELRQKVSRPYDILHIGVQPHSAQRETIDKLLSSGDHVLFWNDLHREGLLRSIEKAVHLGEKRAVWLRINLDGLAQSQGGNSQSWPTGIQFAELMDTLSWIISQNIFFGASIGPYHPHSANNTAVRAAAQLTSHLVYTESARRVITQFHGRHEL